MKSICALGLFLLFATAVISQDKQKEEKLKEHERIIWAGTGIDLNEKSKDVKNIPDAVISSFRRIFPDQSLDNVRKFRGLYALTFSNDVFVTTFIFKANGDFVEARTVGNPANLPSAIVEKVKQANAEYVTNDVVVIEKADKKKLYRLHLKKNNSIDYVVYNEAGETVKYDYELKNEK